MLQSVQAVLEALAARRMSLAVAEGDTGGVLLDALTAVAGSSAVVRGGVVAYHDDLKRQVLGVAAEVLVGHGAVSGEVALAMNVSRTASVRALTPVTVASCDRETFDEFIRPLFVDDR